MVRKVGREKDRKPNDNLLKTTYHEKLKEDIMKCKSKRYSFRQNGIREVEKSVEDPNTFWNKWENTGENIVSLCTPNIYGDKWYEYFKLRGFTNQNADVNECNHAGKQNMVFNDDLR